MTAALARLRALSVRQPWAHLILAGLKPIENRSWSTNYRGLLVLHAGARLDPRGFAFAAAQGIHLDRHALPTGFLGTVQLRALHHASSCSASCSPWAEPGLWHWEVVDPRPFEAPIPGGGALRLFIPPQPVLAACA